MTQPLQLSLIWAQARNRVIGKSGQMPWHLPEDLAHFKRVTMHAPVIMGRKTWDSLPERFRPLPGRLNIVVTRQTDLDLNGALTAPNLAQALSAAQKAASDSIWVIGGAQLYAQALSLAQRVVLTEIDAAWDGDAFAPELDESWQLCPAGTAQSAPLDSSWQTSKTGLRYRFLVFERNSSCLEAASTFTAHTSTS